MHATRQRSSPRNTSSQFLERPTGGHGALQIHEQRKRLADLAEDDRSYITCALVYARRGDGAHMLALRRRRRHQPIALVRIDDHLGAAVTDRPGQGNDLNDVWFPPQDPTRGHDDGRPPKSCLTARGHPEIKLDDITRRQHPATHSLRQ